MFPGLGRRLVLRCAGGQQVATGSELINIFEAHSSHSVFLYDTPSVQNGGENRQKLIQSLSGRAFYNALQYIFLLLISQIQFKAHLSSMKENLAKKNVQ